MAFLHQRDESLLAPSTDLSNFMNKKDSILEIDDNPMLEIVLKQIEFNSTDSDVYSDDQQSETCESESDVQVESDRPEADELLTDGNTPQVKKN